jgi:hypothetical protein
MTLDLAPANSFRLELCQLCRTSPNSQLRFGYLVRAIRGRLLESFAGRDCQLMDVWAEARDDAGAGPITAFDPVAASRLGGAFARFSPITPRPLDCRHLAPEAVVMGSRSYDPGCLERRFGPISCTKGAQKRCSMNLAGALGDA